MLSALCCAWRWTIVAGGLGINLSLPAAVAAYCRSQFLNVILPGGIVGDVRGAARVMGAHAFTFLIAARTAGTMAPPSRMLPVALLVMMAMVLPNVGGWGPREGVTAWAFGAAGLGAGRGVATAVVYGVLVLVASLPGAGVLLLRWFRHGKLPGATEPPLRERPARA